MASWKCISSGNILDTCDEEYIIKEMERNKSYERVIVEKVKVIDAVDGTHNRKRKEKE